MTPFSLKCEKYKIKTLKRHPQNVQHLLGLKTNFTNSLYKICRQKDLDWAAQILGSSVGLLPTTYPGLQMGAKNSKKRLGYSDREGVQ